MQEKMGVKLSRKDLSLIIQKGKVSFFDKNKTLGWESLDFGISVNGKTEMFPETCRQKRIKHKNGLIEFQLTAGYPVSRLSEVISVTCNLPKSFICVRRELFNNTARPVKLDAVLDGFKCQVLFPNSGPYDVVRFGHLNNVRLEKMPFSRAEYPYIRNVPSRRTLLGDSEDQTMPFIFFCNQTLGTFLYEASCQEDVFRRLWEIESVPILDYGKNKSILKYYRGIQKDIHEHPYILRPGKSFTGSYMFYQIKTRADINDIHDDYLDCISELYQFRDECNSLRKAPVYCTWNYGGFRNISEKSVLRQAAFISKNFSDIRFFQIDSGYQLRGGDFFVNAGKFYPDPENNYDPVKFPNGMKHVADRIKKLGLRPAIWWTPTISVDSKLAKEHPDWLAKDRNGNVWTNGKAGALDLSLQPVREFVESVLAVLFQKWGFEGIKLDFWSHAFEKLDVRLAGHPTEAREWLLKTIRDKLPKDGFLETCCSTGMGNPFLAKYADAYRVGMDIGVGDWREHVLACNWAFPLLSVESRKTFLLNMDSFGINHGLSDQENLSRFTWCFITQGVLEIGGDLTKLSKKQQTWLEKITACSDRGYKCLCPDKKTFFNEPLPEILYVKYPKSSEAGKKGIACHIAVFNWEDVGKVLTFPFSWCKLTGKEKFSNFWTGKRIVYRDKYISHFLGPRESILIEVKSKRGGGIK